MPFKNKEDRQRYQKERKKAERTANGPRVRMIGRQQKQLVKVDNAVNAKLRERPGTIKSPRFPREYDPLGLGGPTFTEAVAGEAEFSSRRPALRITAEMRERAAAPSLPSLEDLDSAPGLGRHASLSWDGHLPSDIEGDEARALALSVYLSTGPNPDREAGPTPNDLASKAGVAANELAVSLRGLTMRGRLYVSERGNLSLVSRSESAPEPWNVCLDRLNAVLRDRRNPIEESFELKEAFESEGAHDISRPDLLGA